VSINVFLFFGLTGVVRKFLPDIKKKTGIGVDFNRVWATLPFGTLKVSDLQVANPKGFGANDMPFLFVGKGRANLGLLSLLSGTVNISSVRLQDAKLTLVKNETGRINSVAFEEITGLLSTQKQRQQPSTGIHAEGPSVTAETKSGEIPPGQEPQQASPSIPRTVIGKARIDTVVEYIDRTAAPGNAARIALAVKINADDITTFGDPEKETGTFSIKGHMDGKPTAFAIDVKGRTAPINDPHKPTFNVEGTITNICTADFKELADAIGIESEHIDLNIHIQCSNGVFVRGICFITAKIKKLKVTGKSADKMQGMSIDSLSVSIPLKGTVDAPEMDIIGALTANLAGNLDQVLRSINVDQKKVDKAITGFLNNVLGGNKKK